MRPIHRSKRLATYYASIGDENSRDALEAETEAIKLRWWLQRFPEAYALAKATRPRAEAALGIDDALSLYLLRAETALSSNVEGAAVAVDSGRRLVDRLTELRGRDHRTRSGPRATCSTTESRAAAGSAAMRN